MPLIMSRYYAAPHLERPANMPLIMSRYYAAPHLERPAPNLVTVSVQ